MYLPITYLSSTASHTFSLSAIKSVVMMKVGRNLKDYKTPALIHYSENPDKDKSPVFPYAIAIGNKFPSHIVLQSL